MSVTESLFLDPISAEIWDMKYRFKRPDGVAVDQTVEVTGAAPLVESSASDLGTVVDQKQVRDLPVGVNVVSLDDLKDKLVGVIIVALAVSFLAQIAIWDGKTDLLSYGLSIALVILALGVFSYFRRKKKDDAL